MSPRAKWTIGASAAIPLVVVALLALLGPEWLRGKLIDEARVKLSADLKIQALTFSAFRGEANLKGIAFDRKTASSEVYTTIPSLRLKLRVLPLLRRSLQIEHLEANHPKIAWTIRQPPDPERPSVFAKLRMIGAKRQRADRKVELWVDHLILRDATVEFTSLREGRDPFVARATEIQYSANSVSLDSFGTLAYGADIESKIDFGGPPALLRKKGSTTPSTFALTEVDLASVDKYFDQSDALVVSGGKLDLRYTLGEDRQANVEADFKGLQLGQNPQAANQEFAFVAIPRLREFVEARKGNLNLAFALEDRAEASEDLRALLDEVWTGMWTALIKSMTQGTLKEAFDKGKQKLLERLKPKGRK